MLDMEREVAIKTAALILAGMILLFFTANWAWSASHLVADISYTEPADEDLEQTTLACKQDGMRTRYFYTPATGLSGGGEVAKKVKLAAPVGETVVRCWAYGRDLAGNVGPRSDEMVLAISVKVE